MSYCRSSCSHHLFALPLEPVVWPVRKRRLGNRTFDDFDPPVPQDDPVPDGVAKQVARGWIGVDLEDFEPEV